MEELISMVPYGAEIAGLVVALAALVSALVPDSKLGWFAKPLNWLALNVGRAANDPTENE